MNAAVAAAIRSRVKVEAALRAYRLSIEYTRKVYEKWEPRQEEVRKLDDFHRTACACENDLFRAERLRERAKEVLLATARGGKPFLHPFDNDFFAKCRNRDFLRATRALEEALK